MKISLKARLIISSLIVIIICGVAVTLVGIHLIGNGIIGQAQDKARTDLNSARHLYHAEIKRVNDIIRLTAQRFFIKDALLEDDMGSLERALEKIRKRESLDILTLTDKNAKVIVRSRNPAIKGDLQATDQLVGRVLSRKETAASTIIVSKEELLKEGADLAKQANIKFIPTPKAKPRPETEETSGMMIKAVAPVFDYDGSLMGVLYGGNLLNRDYGIVDKVKETVYQEVKYEGKEIGTATIFQKDLRISTNVKKNDGSRAIGTRVSKEVYDQVLIKGLPWIHRAFVVNNWYISAYGPIKDIEDKIIGVLYVGILEEKFVDMKRKAILTFWGITFAGMLVAFVVSNLLANGILGPVKRLLFASSQWAKGNLKYRVKIKVKNEIGELGETFNSMASSLNERDEQLQEYTQQQLMKSERLATTGQLAAGVAHEINNPIGAVIMYTHLSLEDMDAKDPRRENLNKVVKEATRCKDIVKGLLDFSRQTEPKIEESNVNDILEQTLALLEKQALFRNVKIEKIFSSSIPNVMIDVSQMHQVFTNIIMNAAEAMGEKGKFVVTTKKSSDDKYIVIDFSDTGCGIPKENIEKLFDPFFTTREVGHGTGLGLSISYGIIAKHQGAIAVKSELGKGTTFTIKLPVKHRED
jgi:two-component system, NtrC family, sensor kinase